MNCTSAFTPVITRLSCMKQLFPPAAASSSRTHSSQMRRARDLLKLTLLMGLHPTLVKGLRAPKGRR